MITGRFIDPRLRNDGLPVPDAPVGQLSPEGRHSGGQRTPGRPPQHRRPQHSRRRRGEHRWDTRLQHGGNAAGEQEAGRRRHSADAAHGGATGPQPPPQVDGDSILYVDNDGRDELVIVSVSSHFLKKEAKSHLTVYELYE